MNRRVWRKDCPDQAVSAETSITTGSMRVSTVSSWPGLNLSRVVDLIRSGQECSPAAGVSWEPSCFAAAGLSDADRPTMRNSPSMRRPATTASGLSIGPMTAAQTTSMVSWLCSLDCVLKPISSTEKWLYLPPGRQRNRVHTRVAC